MLTLKTPKVQRAREVPPKRAAATADRLYHCMTPACRNGPHGRLRAQEAGLTCGENATVPESPCEESGEESGAPDSPNSTATAAQVRTPRRL